MGEPPTGLDLAYDEKSTSYVQTKEKKRYTVWGGLGATSVASWIIISHIFAVPADSIMKHTNQNPFSPFLSTSLRSSLHHFNLLFYLFDEYL